jgi:hypothetical protein
MSDRMTKTDDLIDMIKQEDNIMIVEVMDDEMKKQVLQHEMKRLEELVPFINKGMQEAFEEEDAIVIVMDNNIDVIRENAPSDADGDGFTLQTESGKIIGEAIYDEDELEDLQDDPNAYFISENFVMYTDLSTPGEKQFFVVYSTNSTFFTDKDLESVVSSLTVAIPSTPTDHYIKDCFDLPHDEKLGTLIIGFTE